MAANERADGVQRLQARRAGSKSVMALTPMSDSSERAFTFVAEYQDGSKEYFQIHNAGLNGLEEEPLTIAWNWQEEGKLRPGKIKRVYRL